MSVRTHHGDLVGVVLGAGLTIDGVLYLGRAIVHLRDPDYMRHRDLARLVRADLRLAWAWVFAAAGLTVAGACFVPTLATGAVGAGLAAIVYLRAWFVGSDTAALELRYGVPGGSARVAGSGSVERLQDRAARAPLLPGSQLLPRAFGPKRPWGEISLFLTKTLMVAALIGGSYASLALASIGTSLVKSHPASPGPTPQAWAPPASAAKVVPPRKATYAELCPEHPDPLSIGFGLGQLFRRDGAIQAGCGEPSLTFGRVHIAEGLCNGVLRSLAVSGVDGVAVLLYGAPARFAFREAVAGRLLDATVARPGGGDLALITTTAGPTAFSRVVPARWPGTPGATRCGDVNEVAQPYTRLPPSMGALWVQLAQLDGWSWPEYGARAFTYFFRSAATGRVVATGACANHGSVCRLRSSYGIWTSDAAPMFTLHELAATFPR